MNTTYSRNVTDNNNMSNDFLFNRIWDSQSKLNQINQSVPMNPINPIMIMNQMKSDQNQFNQSVPINQFNQTVPMNQVPMNQMNSVYQARIPESTRNNSKYEDHQSHMALLQQERHSYGLHNQELCNDFRIQSINTRNTKDIKIQEIPKPFIHTNKTT